MRLHEGPVGLSLMSRPVESRGVCQRGIWKRLELSAPVPVRIAGMILPLPSLSSCHMLQLELATSRIQDTPVISASPNVGHIHASE